MGSHDPHPRLQERRKMATRSDVKMSNVPNMYQPDQVPHDLQVFGRVIRSHQIQQVFQALASSRDDRRIHQFIRKKSGVSFSVAWQAAYGN